MANAQTVGTWGGARREMEEEWVVVRTLRGGSRAMRKAGELFTPATDRERKDSLAYSARLKRSVLFPGYDRAVRKIAALPFQKEPQVGDLPQPLDRIVKDADRCGTPLAAWAKQVYTDAVDRGIGYIIVDNVPQSGVPLPVADELDIRPYFVRVEPDNVVGHQTRTENGRDIVTEFRYREWSWEEKDGVDVAVERVRVWTETTCEVWRRSTKQQVVDRESQAASSSAGGYVLESSIEHGFGVVPLVPVYTRRTGTLQALPPMIDLGWINVAHWNSSSMQGSALSFARSPVFKLSGVSHETADQQPQLGPGATIVDPSDNVSAEFVEPAGTSLDAGRKDIEALERQMDALGTMPLQSAGGPDTATGEVRADMDAKSEAQSWVEAMEWALVQAFHLAARHIGETLDEDFAVMLFKDSSLIAGKATDGPMLLSLSQAGKITDKTLLTNMIARGIIVGVEDVDAEIEELQAANEASVQRQMDAFAQQAIAARGQGDPQQDDEEGDPEQDVPADGAAA